MKERKKVRGIRERTSTPGKSLMVRRDSRTQKSLLMMAKSDKTERDLWGIEGGHIEQSVKGMSKLQCRTPHTNNQQGREHSSTYHQPSCLKSYKVHRHPTACSSDRKKSQFHPPECRHPHLPTGSLYRHLDKVHPSNTRQ